MEFLYPEFLILFGIIGWLIKDKFGMLGLKPGLIILFIVLLFVTKSVALIGILIAIVLAATIWGIAMKGNPTDLILWVVAGGLFLLAIA